MFARNHRFVALTLCELVDRGLRLIKLAAREKYADQGGIRGVSRVALCIVCQCHCPPSFALGLVVAAQLIV